jgi:hypothetical protein
LKAAHILTFCGKNDLERPDAVYWPEFGRDTIGCRKQELAYFVNGLLEKRPFELNAIDQAKETLEVVVPAAESAETGRIFTLPPEESGARRTSSDLFDRSCGVCEEE